MNRGPIVLVGVLKPGDIAPNFLLYQTIDEAEYLLDQLPLPAPDDDLLVTKLRQRLQDLLTALRAGAEGHA